MRAPLRLGAASLAQRPLQHPAAASLAPRELQRLRQAAVAAAAPFLAAAARREHRLRPSVASDPPRPATPLVEPALEFLVPGRLSLPRPPRLALQLPAASLVLKRRPAACSAARPLRRPAACSASLALLNSVLTQKGVGYEKFILSL